MHKEENVIWGKIKGFWQMSYLIKHMWVIKASFKISVTWSDKSWWVNLTGVPERGICKKLLIWDLWHWAEHFENRLKILSKSQFIPLRKTKEPDLLPVTVFQLHLFSFQRLGLQLSSLDKPYEKQVGEHVIATAECANLELLSEEILVSTTLGAKTWNISLDTGFLQAPLRLQGQRGQI